MAMRPTEPVDELFLTDETRAICSRSAGTQVEVERTAH